MRHNHGKFVSSWIFEELLKPRCNMVHLRGFYVLALQSHRNSKIGRKWGSVGLKLEMLPGVMNLVASSSKVAETEGPQVGHFNTI